MPNTSGSDPPLFHMDRHTDTQTDRWLTGKFDDYRPLSPYTQQRGLIMNANRFGYFSERGHNIKAFVLLPHGTWTLIPESATSFYTILTTFGSRTPTHVVWQRSLVDRPVRLQNQHQARAALRSSGLLWLLSTDCVQSPVYSSSAGPAYTPLPLSSPVPVR